MEEKKCQTFLKGSSRHPTRPPYLSSTSLDHLGRLEISALYILEKYDPSDRNPYFWEYMLAVIAGNKIKKTEAFFF